METKCKSCLGCNRLEYRNFKEVYRCENYMRGAKDNEVSGHDEHNNIRRQL